MAHWAGSRRRRRVWTLPIAAGVALVGLVGCGESVPEAAPESSASEESKSVFTDNSEALEVSMSFLQASFDTLALVDPSDQASVDKYVDFLGPEQADSARKTFEGDGKNRRLEGEVLIPNAGLVDRSSTNPETVRVLACVDKSAASWVDIETGATVQSADEPVEELLYVLEFSEAAEAGGKIQEVMGGNGTLSCETE